MRRGREQQAKRQPKESRRDLPVVHQEDRMCHWGQSAAVRDLAVAAQAALNDGQEVKLMLHVGAEAAETVLSQTVFE